MDMVSGVKGGDVSATAVSGEVWAVDLVKMYSGALAEIFASITSWHY
jgi:hypothetical protein